MCSNCKVTYCGKTFHHFYARMAEHMEISNQKSTLKVLSSLPYLTICYSAIAQ